MTIHGKLKQFENLNVDDVVLDSIEQTKPELLEAQKEQMLNGLRADGSLIGKYRNPAYAKQKNQQNPKAGYGNMDWRKTGALYNDMFVDVRPDSYVIDSADAKTGKLIDAHGDPFGVGGEFKIKYLNDALHPTIINKVKEIVKL